jgi:hypothetical protein
MTLSLSAVVLLLVIMVLLIRKAGLKTSHAVVCILLGFYLSSSTVAPEMHRLTQSVINVLSGIDL